MGRKNKNAGQPNRSAQIDIRVKRRWVNEKYKTHGATPLVYHVETKETTDE